MITRTTMPTFWQRSWVMPKCRSLQVRYCQELGLPDTQASRLYIYSGLGSLLIRPVIGRLHDIPRITPCYIYTTGAALEAVSTFLLSLATTNLHFVVYFALYGVCDGAVGCGLSIAILNSLQEKQRPLGFGVYQCIACLMSAVGPALGGKTQQGIHYYICFSGTRA